MKYQCEICKSSFQTEERALHCEAQGRLPFMFEIGNKVLVMSRFDGDLPAEIIYRGHDGHYPVYNTSPRINVRDECLSTDWDVYHCNIVGTDENTYNYFLRKILFGTPSLPRDEKLATRFMATTNDFTPCLSPYIMSTPVLGHKLRQNIWRMGSYTVPTLSRYRFHVLLHRLKLWFRS